MTPAKSDINPSSLIILINVAIVDDGFFCCSFSSPDSCFRAVMRVLTTQIGFVRITVALPANAPAIIDSAVVSLRVPRPACSAAFSKAARDHSYPEACKPDSHMCAMPHLLTIVVDEVGDRNSKQC